MSGRYNGRASVMQFYKNNAMLRWHVFFGLMSNIRAYSHTPDDGHLYVCGDFNQEEDEKNVDVASYSAGIAKMNDNGDVRWYISASGPIP